jgi:excisionase family DNA binding protein
MEKKINNHKKSNEKGIYTLKDLAKMFQVTVRTVYNWMDDSRFSFIKVGSKTYITEQQLQEFLSKHEVKSFNVRRAW